MSDEKIRRLTPLQSFELLEENSKAILIDVRTSAEVKFLGAPVGSVHIPWMEFPEMKVLEDFVDNVRQQVDQKGPLLLICRSGQRSMNAAKALEAAGFDELINVEEGFEGDLDSKGHRNLKNGWRFHGLPWKQK